jgi:hypothetical protein
LWRDRLGFATDAEAKQAPTRRDGVRYQTFTMSLLRADELSREKDAKTGRGDTFVR